MSLYHLALESAAPRPRTGGAAGARAAVVGDPANPPPPPDPAKPGGGGADLTKYIPTETIALYVAALSLIKPLKDTTWQFDPRLAYLTFLVITPALVLLLHYRRLKLEPPPAGEPPPPPPYWGMTAATLAFAAWAIAVPENGFFDSAPAAAGAIAGFAALVVSICINLVAPFFEPPKPPAA